MNPILAGLAIPNALPAARMAVAAAQAAVQPFSEMMEFALGQSDPMRPEKPTASNWPDLHAPDLLAKASSMLDDLQRRIGQAFSGVGIQLGEDIHLRMNQVSGVVGVTGDHPNRIAIEAIFAENPEFGNDLEQLAKITRLLQPADHQGQTKGPQDMIIKPFHTEGGIRIEV